MKRYICSFHSDVRIINCKQISLGMRYGLVPLQKSHHFYISLENWRAFASATLRIPNSSKETLDSTSSRPLSSPLSQNTLHFTNAGDTEANTISQQMEAFIKQNRFTEAEELFTEADNKGVLLDARSYNN